MNTLNTIINLVEVVIEYCYEYEYECNSHSPLSKL